MRILFSKKIFSIYWIVLSSMQFFSYMSTAHRIFCGNVYSSEAIPQDEEVTVS